MDTAVRLIDNSPGDRIAGLDGVRGLAVALVLGFHLYPRLVPGGWLGVSLFFTLSGFLITTVILRDLDNNTFSFRSFYARRIRRLLPAALLVLAVFSVSWTLFGWFNTSHRSDVFFAFLQIANWQQIWEGVPYGTALSSPVVHYWSLAIEEQAYIILPLLIVAVGARKLRLVAAVLFIASVAATFLADANQSVIYFGTHTRAAEILAGVIAASLVHRTTKTPHTFFASVISVVGIVYLIGASLVVRLSDEIVYQGGLVTTGIISALVITTIPHSQLAKIFSVTPLVWLGTVSYGIYLIHWPVLQTLKRTNLPQWTISPLTLGITLALAAMMYRAFEQPLRFSFSGRQVVATATAIVCVAGVSFTFATRAPATFEDIEDTASQATLPTITTRAPRVFFFGDSKMALFYKSLQNRALAMSVSEREQDRFTLSGSFTRIGCPIGVRGYLMDNDIEKKVGEGCDWSTYDEGTEASDIALVWSGTWDAADRRIPELFGDKFVNLSDADYQTWIKGEYLKLVQHLRQTRGVRVVAFINYLGDKLETRQDSYTQYLNKLAQQDDIILLDIVDYLEGKPSDDYFPDGTHVSIGEPTVVSNSLDNSGADIYEKWLEPALCAALIDKQPDLIGTAKCPEVDHSPRVKN